MLGNLASAGLRPKHQPPVISLGSLQIVQLLYESPGAFIDLQVDLLLAQSEYHRHAPERRVSTRLLAVDLDVYVLACEDLILHKLLAGRLIDRADAAVLMRANRANLDLGYLVRWTTELCLEKELDEVLREAFPGGPPPEFSTHF